MSKDNHLATVRRQLDELRRRTGVQKGDELDHALVAVEGLAATMAAMSTDVAALVAEGERNIGAVVSAALTKGALWRVVVLPAVIGALVVVMIMGVSITTQSVMAQRVIQADHDAMAAEIAAERADLHRQFEALQADIDKQRADIEAERQRIEATLPSMLLKRAETLTGAAREIVRQEAATPGIVDVIAHNGAVILRAAQLNGGTLCPQVVYQGSTPYCQYRAE